MLAIGFDGGALAVLVVIYVIWDGASESIYSLASAHAADRAGKDDMVALSSSLLFAWSLSGFVVPGIVTALSAVYGTQAFIYVAIVIATAFCLFVLWRVATTRAGAADRDRQFRADVGTGAVAGGARLRAGRAALDSSKVPRYCRVAARVPAAGLRRRRRNRNAPSASKACLTRLVRSIWVAKKSAADVQ